MDIHTDVREKMAVVTPYADKLVSSNAADLKAQLTKLQGEGNQNMILDLQHVAFVDSSGLSALLVGNRICRENNGTFIITGLHEQVNKLIQIAQLHAVLIILPTLSEASDFILMEEIEKELRDS